MRDQTDFANTSSTTTAASTTICFLIAIIIIVIIVVVFIVLILQQQQQLLQLPPTPPLLLLRLQLLLLLPRLHKHKTIFINNNSDKNNNNNTNSIFWRKKHILREQTFKWNGCWTIFLKICLFFWPTNIIWWKLVVLQHAQTTHLCCSVVWDIGHLHEESRKGTSSLHFSCPMRSTKIACLFAPVALVVGAVEPWASEAITAFLGVFDVFWAAGAAQGSSVCTESLGCIFGVPS